jgi:DNA-binding beta-propeller fold protein YncE
MGPALQAEALKPAGRNGWISGGRRRAALLLFSALLAAGCGRGKAPAIESTWRIGLGAAAIALDPAQAQVAVACSRSNDVWVLKLKDGALLHRIDTLPRPRAILFDPVKPAFFVAEGLSSVAQVRLEDERVARRFKPRSRVGRLSYEPVSGRLFGGHVGLPTLGVYRLRDMHLESSLAVGGEAVDLAFDGNRAWVATRKADALVQLSLTDMSVRNAILAGPDPRHLDLRPGQDRALLACHGRTGEAAPLALPTPVPSPNALSSLQGISESAEEEVEAFEEEALEEEDASDPSWDGGGLAVFRLSDARRLDYLELPGGPIAALASPDASRAAVACEDGVLRMVDLKRRRVLGELELGGRPGAMIRHPDGKRLLIALYDAKALLVVRPGAGW